MDKYKILGAINFLFGASYLFLALQLQFFLNPQAEILYKDFGIQTVPLVNTVSPLICLIIGIINIFIGIKLFSKNGNKQTFLKISIAVIIGTLLIGGYLLMERSTALFIPLDSVTSQ